MSEFHDLLLGNALGAAVLAVVVALVSPAIRRPTVRHALWLLVLGRCFAPPLVEVALLPAEIRDAAVPPSIVASAEPLDTAALVVAGNGLSTTSVEPAQTAGHGETSVSAVERDREAVAPIATGSRVAGSRVAGSRVAGSRVAGSRVAGPSSSWLSGLSPSRFPSWSSIPWARLLVLVWWVGAVWVGLLALARVCALARALRHARPATPALIRRAGELARRLGLRRCPPVLATELCLPPVVWAPLARPRIVLPKALVERLSAAERDTVLAHELAHVARSDHWVRLLELLAGIVFWWHPAVFWARRELRDAEERCCDQRVLELLPTHGRAYAEALLETLDFTSHRGRSGTLPAFGSGLETRNRAVRRLSGRLTMILRPRNFDRLHPSLRLVFAAVALAALVVFPIRSSHAGDEAEQAQAEAEAEDARRLGAKAELESIERERQILILEAQSRAAEVARQRQDIERIEEQIAIEEREAAAELARAEAEGDQERVEEIRRQIELDRQERELQLEQQTLAIEEMEASLALERQAQEAMLDMRRRALEGREDLVRRVEARRRQLEDQMLAREQEIAERARGIEERHLALRQARLEALRGAASEHGEMAEELARQQAELERERVAMAMRYEAERAERTAERERRRLEKAVEAGEVSRAEAEETFRRHHEQAEARHRELMVEQVAHEVAMLQERLPHRLAEMRAQLAEAGEGDSELAAKIEALHNELDAAFARAAGEEGASGGEQ